MVCCSGELQTAVLEAPDASPAHLANRAALARRAKLWMGDEAATVVDMLEVRGRSYEGVLCLDGVEHPPTRPRPRLLLGLLSTGPGIRLHHPGRDLGIRRAARQRELSLRETKRPTQVRALHLCREQIGAGEIHPG